MSSREGMKPLPVACPRCARTFAGELHEDPHEGGVYQYLRCPHCESEFPVCVIDVEGVEIRDELAVLDRKAMRLGRLMPKDAARVRALRKRMPLHVTRVKERPKGG